MTFNMPLEYVAVAVLFSSTGTAAFLLCVLYAKGYLGRKQAPPRAAVRPVVAPAEAAPTQESGVEGVVRARNEAEARVRATAQNLRMQAAMLESGLEATKAG